MNVTTFPSPNAGTADLRPLSSADMVVMVNGQPVDVRGTSVEQPAAQPHGGGWNSSLRVGAVSLGQPLAAGASVAVQFVLGIKQAGVFRFFINVEAGEAAGAPAARGNATGDKEKGGFRPLPEERPVGVPRSKARGPKN